MSTLVVPRGSLLAKYAGQTIKLKLVMDIIQCIEMKKKEKIRREMRQEYYRLKLVGR